MVALAGMMPAGRVVTQRKNGSRPPVDASTSARVRLRRPRSVAPRLRRAAATGRRDGEREPRFLALARLARDALRGALVALFRFDAVRAGLEKQRIGERRAAFGRAVHENLGSGLVQLTTSSISAARADARPACAASRSAGDASVASRRYCEKCLAASRS